MSIIILKCDIFFFQHSEDIEYDEEGKIYTYKQNYM